MSGLLVAERGSNVVFVEPPCDERGACLRGRDRRGPSRDHPVAAHSPILPSGTSAPHTDLEPSILFYAVPVESRNLFSHCSMFHSCFKLNLYEKSTLTSWPRRKMHSLFKSGTK